MWWSAVCRGKPYWNGIKETGLGPESRETFNGGRTPWMDKEAWQGGYWHPIGACRFWPSNRGAMVTYSACECAPKPASRTGYIGRQPTRWSRSRWAAAWCRCLPSIGVAWMRGGNSQAATNQNSHPGNRALTNSDLEKLRRLPGHTDLSAR